MYKTITIMLLAFVASIAVPLITPALALIAAEYPNESISTIALVANITAFAIIPGMFISIAMITRTDRKIVVIIGYLLVIIGGIAPTFLKPLELILIFRAIIGLGVGLVIPLPTTYLSEYPKEKRSLLLGLGQTIVGILSVGMLILSGIVAQYSWRNVFLLYGICIIILVMTATGIPKSAPLKAMPPDDKIATDNDKKAKNGNNKLFVKIFISQFVTMAVLVAVMSFISFYIVEYGLGGTAGTEAYMISSIGTLCVAGGSAAAPFFIKRFDRWSGFLLMILAFLAAIIYAFPMNIFVLGIGYSLVFVFISMFNIYGTSVIMHLIPTTKVAIYMAISCTAIFTGQFISPFLMSAVAGIMGLKQSESGVYFGLAVIIIIVAIINMPRRRKSATAEALLK